MARRLAIILVGGTAAALGIWLAGSWISSPTRWTPPIVPDEKRVADEAALRAREDRPPEPWNAPPVWWKKTTIDAFEQATAGKSWPSAQRAVVAFAKESSNDPGNTGDELDDALSGSQTAIEYGCDDPLILYIRWMYERQSRRHPSVAGCPELSKAADVLHGSTYPAVRKCMAQLVAAESNCYFAKNAGLPKAKKYAEAGVALSAEVFADPELPAAEALRVVRFTSRASLAMYKDRAVLTDPVLAALDASSQPPSVKLTARGEYLIDRAWDARGGGYANTVTNEGWAGFRENLTKAREALEEAFKLDPSNGAAARAMIVVCMGEGGARADMEQWFSRAMQINPGDYGACDRKLYYLEPKWHGSADEMISFAREMAQSAKDPRAVQIPLILADAYWRLAASNVIGTPPLAEYFQSNPGAWGDITKVYEAYLEKVPKSRYHRTRYAVLAASAGHPDVARAQFDILGDNHSRAVLVDWAMTALREKLDREATDRSTSKPGNF